jgi:hypothetical protein
MNQLFHIPLVNHVGFSKGRDKYEQNKKYMLATESEV